MATEEIKELRLDLIDPSPSNPRLDGMTAAALAGLISSVKEQGIISPMVVRQHPTKKGRYEQVYGHRRCAAGKFARLEKGPCIIREYTDREVREIQIVENLQREDVSEIEEAGGYQELMELPAVNGKPQHTVESIAKTIGKSPAYVYARLKLLRATDLMLTALQGKAVSVEAVLCVARIPDEKLAFKASKEILRLEHVAGDDNEVLKSLAELIKNPDGDTHWSPMSARQAKAFVADNYTRRLKGSPFDQEDATLVPDATPCSKCPFRSGNLKDIDPADIGGTDVCTSPGCFKKKTEATKRAELNKIKDKGLVPLQGRQAREALQSLSSEQPAADGFVDLNEKVPGKRKTYGELLDLKPKDGEEVAEYIAQHPEVKSVRKTLVKVEDVAPQLKELGVKITAARPAQLSEEQQRAQSEEQRAAALAFFAVLNPKVETAIRKMTPRDALAFLAVQHFGYEAKDVKDMPVPDLIKDILEQQYIGEPNWQNKIESGDLAICELLDIDLKSLEKQVLDARKAAAAKATEDAGRKSSEGKKPDAAKKK